MQVIIDGVREGRVGVLVAAWVRVFQEAGTLGFVKPKSAWGAWHAFVDKGCACIMLRQQQLLQSRQ